MTLVGQQPRAQFVLQALAEGGKVDVPFDADRIARARGQTAASLIAAIDSRRPPEVGLATAIRLFVLDAAQRG